MMVWSRFVKSEAAVAATEFALILPVLVSMLLGTIDLGRGLWVSYKVLGATQTVADLLTRQETVSTTDLEEALTAMEMIMAPFPRSDVGYDIVGIEFAGQDAEVRWRETANMLEDNRLPELADGLGADGEGVIAVTLTYHYEPQFYAFITGDIDLRETAILRGRRVAYVRREG